MLNLFDIQYFRKTQGMVKLLWKQKALHTYPLTGTSCTYHPKSNEKIIHILRKVSTNLRHCVKPFFWSSELQNPPCQLLKQGCQTAKSIGALPWPRTIKSYQIPPCLKRAFKPLFCCRSSLTLFSSTKMASPPGGAAMLGLTRALVGARRTSSNLGEVVHPILVQTYANCWDESVLKLLLLIFQGKASPLYTMSDHLKQSCLWVYTVRLSAN